ncbi:hypothetical protein Q6670_004114 [Salmonella enterica]|nr:hypothetical protein [Salmonella enterica]
MLTSEQREHFTRCVKRAAKITDSRSWHVRVSGRQLADNSWCVGLIFGKKGASEWMHITTVPDDLLLEAKRDYRKELVALTQQN